MPESTEPRPTFAVSLALILALLAGPAAPEPATPSALERDPSGWIDLLAEAGPSLKGWTRLPVQPRGKLDPNSQWSLDAPSGVLTCRGDGGHDWMRWDRELSDFVLHVEWKFEPVTSGKAGYNSGVYVRNSDDATVWHQAQVGGGPAAYLFGETLRDGALGRVDLSKQQSDKRVKPAGQWNNFEVTCRGKQVDLWVNGEVVNRWDDCPVAKGFVGLEAEGYRIEFRNVKVKPL